MPTALLSIFDKTDIETLANGLSLLGWDMLASGGTADVIRKMGLTVLDVADYSGSPEILEGRVKTLHPAVHGGILARNTEADTADLIKIGAKLIDLVVVNLYPFEKTVEKPQVTHEEVVDNIDIGGVALMRAAAKNYARVTIITDYKDYIPVLMELRENGKMDIETRLVLAQKAFKLTAAYDAFIAQYLGNIIKAKPREEKQLQKEMQSEPISEESLDVKLYPVQTLRYGENPHQEATLYGYQPNMGAMGGKLIQGKPLSYNNLLDLDAAWRTAFSFERDTVAIVKHLSPCGIASANNLEEAFRLALASDPISAFGGVIAVNRLFDRATSKALGKLFIECIVAPGFTPKALETLTEKKNLRLIVLEDKEVTPPFEMRSIHQGVLIQDIDLGDPKDRTNSWKVVTERSPSEEENRALAFAWKAVQHVKSNAIVLAHIEGGGEATIGIGGGQPNRVDCVRIAVERAGIKARGAVMASDAFFPFQDSVEEAAKVGIAAIIQPGGSVRDQETIDVANHNNIAMIFTGIRHFRH